MILGEVRTSLLRNSLPLPPQATAELLSLRPAHQVTATDRPINRTLSADTLTGVDCTISTEPKQRARGIGTVATRAVVVGGMVAQASSRARLVWTDHHERRSWAHYARKRGTIEILNPVSTEAVVAGFLRRDRRADTLDLGAICQRQLGTVQVRPQLDHKPKMRTRPTVLRWTAVAARDDDDAPSVRLHVDDATTRSVWLVLPPRLMNEAARFCEDLAMHDWLTTALDNAVAQAERDMARDADPIDVLGAALSLLVRLWMPGAHVDGALKPLWRDLESTPGFTGPWERQVAWMRDQIAIRALTALQEARH